MNAKVSASDGEAPVAKGHGAANISYIGGRVWTGGDLPIDLGDEAMLAALVAIQDAGVMSPA